MGPRRRTIPCLFSKGQLMPEHLFGQDAQRYKYVNTHLHKAVEYLWWNPAQEVHTDAQGQWPVVVNFHNKRARLNCGESNIHLCSHKTSQLDWSNAGFLHREDYSTELCVHNVFFSSWFISTINYWRENTWNNCDAWIKTSSCRGWKQLFPFFIQ